MERAISDSILRPGSPDLFKERIGY
jgi:hypothetical protein